LVQNNTVIISNTYSLNLIKADGDVNFSHLIGGAFAPTTLQILNNNYTCKSFIGNITTINRQIAVSSLTGLDFSGTIKNCNLTIPSYSVTANTTLFVTISTGNNRINSVNQIIENCNVNMDTVFINSATATISGVTRIGLICASTDQAIFNQQFFKNNTIQINLKATLKANQNSALISISPIISGLLPTPPTPVITNFTNKALIGPTWGLGPYQIEFKTIEPIANGIIFYGQTYLIQPAMYTISGPGYNIDLSDITIVIYIPQPPPTPPPTPQEVITCCTANVCDVNPQIANFDSSNAIQSQGGQQLVSAVNDFYAGAAAGRMKPSVQPIFKTYGQMMEWKQRQNRR
jgi:hypothetical protein